MRHGAGVAGMRAPDGPAQPPVVADQTPVMRQTRDGGVAVAEYPGRQTPAIGRPAYVWLKKANVFESVAALHARPVRKIAKLAASSESERRGLSGPSIKAGVSRCCPLRAMREPAASRLHPRTRARVGHRAPGLVGVAVSLRGKTVRASVAVITHASDARGVCRRCVPRRQAVIIWGTCAAWSGPRHGWGGMRRSLGERAKASQRATECPTDCRQYARTGAGDAGGSKPDAGRCARSLRAADVTQGASSGNCGASCGGWIRRN